VHSFETASLGRLTYLRSHTANSSSSTTGREYLLDRRRNGRRTLAVRDRLFYEVARRPALIALLRPILGEDIMLWGASVVERAPAQTHIWHTDIETSAPKGGFVTVWVGLENTCRDSTLQLISRSHRFGRPIQQEVHERGLRRGEATDDMVTAWAREHDCQSDLVQPDMNDGQALLFDGRLWHGSHNSGNQSRAALLLQYAAIGTPVLIPTSVVWNGHSASRPWNLRAW
jgi:ectoine hydroxylase-related dioxygenase (phytanoyl-CoA dioxygenase family)